MPSSPARRREARRLRRLTPPRPLNAFFLFRREVQKSLSATQPSITQQLISQYASRKWRMLSDNDRKKYHRTAEIAAEIHKQMYPDYIYSPKRQTSHVGGFRVRFDNGTISWNSNVKAKGSKDNKNSVVSHVFASEPNYFDTTKYLEFIPIDSTDKKTAPTMFSQSNNVLPPLTIYRQASNYCPEPNTPITLPSINKIEHYQTSHLLTPLEPTITFTFTCNIAANL